MHDCRKIEECLVDLVFGELDSDQSERALAELADCPHCRAEYQSFKTTLATFDKAADFMLPDENYWNAYNRRLQTRLATNESVSLWQRLVGFVNAISLRPAWAVSVSVLLMMALLLWFLLKQPTPIANDQAEKGEVQTPSIAGKPENDKLSPNSEEPKNIAGTSSTNRGEDRVQKNSNKLLKNLSPGKRKFEPVAKAPADKRTDVERQTRQPEVSPAGSISEYDYLVRTLASDETVKHFEKAQNLLRTFRNLSSRAATSADEIVDEKNRSRSLLLRNVLLRREAETRGNLPIQEVLSDLEPLLIDIAHLPEKSSHRELRAIRERIQRKEMIGKLQVYSARPVIAETMID
jgi:hypothetical protein